MTKTNYLGTLESKGKWAHREGVSEFEKATYKGESFQDSPPLFFFSPAFHPWVGTSHGPTGSAVIEENQKFSGSRHALKQMLEGVLHTERRGYQRKNLKLRE